MKSYGWLSILFLILALVIFTGRGCGTLINGGRWDEERSSNHYRSGDVDSGKTAAAQEKLKNLAPKLGVPQEKVAQVGDDPDILATEIDIVIFNNTMPCRGQQLSEEELTILRDMLVDFPELLKKLEKNNGELKKLSGKKVLVIPGK